MGVFFIDCVSRQNYMNIIGVSLVTNQLSILTHQAHDSVKKSNVNPLMPGFRD